MNVKLIFSIFILVTLLSIIGCSEVDKTNTNDNPPIKTDMKENTDDPSKATKPKPPSLTVYAGEETVRSILGTYSWSYENSDGTKSAIQADSFAPPVLVKNNNPMQVTAGTNVELDFEKQPDSYTVKIWDRDNNVLSRSEKVILSSKGKVIYEVLAHWEQGTASYVFSLNIE